MDLLGLSEATMVGLLAFAGVMFTGLCAIVVAVLTRENRAQTGRVDDAVNEFESAWKDRGILVEGIHADLDVALERLGKMEAREADCLEALQVALGRIAVLEERIGHDRLGR